jgi:hypothetical protein
MIDTLHMCWQAGPSGLHGRCVSCGHGVVRAAVSAPAYPTSFFNQLICLLWRSLMVYVRNPADVAGRLMMSLSIGIVVGITFMRSNEGKCRLACHAGGFLPFFGFFPI